MIFRCDFVNTKVRIFSKTTSKKQQKTKDYRAAGYSKPNN
jgi:hypothetical protein